MWFNGEREPNTIYVASTSRGKDSTAMLRAIQLLKWPLDMIISVDIWFDETTPAELPPMVKFKNEYDEKVLETFGIPVTRLCARKRSQDVHVERERARETDGESHTSRSADCSTQECIQRSTDGILKDSRTTTTHGASCSRIRPMEDMSSMLTYVDVFYRQRMKGSKIYGFPMIKGAWCNSELKVASLKEKRIREAINFQVCSRTRSKK